MLALAAFERLIPSVPRMGRFGGLWRDGRGWQIVSIGPVIDDTVPPKFAFFFVCIVIKWVLDRGLCRRAGVMRIGLFERVGGFRGCYG